jgi:hypothetical protein
MRLTQSAAAIVILPIVIGLGFTHAACAQDRLGNLLTQLVSGPFDQSILYKIQAEPDDPRTLPALKGAFERSTVKREKELIAWTAMRLGDTSPEYYSYLSGMAKLAIEDRSPLFAKYDSNGSFVRGEFSAVFLNWCAANGKDPRTVAALQVGEYPDDVLALARAQDSRSRELLRQGLESPNPLIVAYSVQGLGRLQDVEALPLIAKAVDRIRESERFVISMNLPWYSRAEAFELMARIIPAQEVRETLTKDVQEIQAEERDRFQSHLKKPLMH